MHPAYADVDDERPPPANEERAFPFLHLNRDASKPRQRGLTEMRGPYYAAFGRRHLQDVLETMGAWVDGVKFSGGAFALFPRRAVRAMVEVCHGHGTYVSTGGFLEHVLAREPDRMDACLEECRELGFDVVEVSSGFLSVPDDDLVRLTRRVLSAGLTPKPEVGVQFGAGGATPERELAAEGTRDPGSAIRVAKRHLDAGAPWVMLESEGVTEGVRAWRTDVVSRVVDELGLEKVMFEAADPAVFEWYVKTFGPDVNLFVDHSQVVQLECLRSGLWGTKATWGRVATYRGPRAEDGPGPRRGRDL